MNRPILVFLSVSICIAQCATIHGKDKANEPIQKREKRSCHYCDEGSYNGPVYHSLQYSGLARSDDGTAQGVYSGAAAAANFGAQSALPSYSLASSIANAGADGAHVTGTGAALDTGAALGTGAAYGAGAAFGTGAALVSGPALGIGALGAGAYNGARVADRTAAYGGSQLTERSVDFGGQQPGYVGHVVGGNAGFGAYGQNKFSGSGSYKEHFSFHNDGGKRYGGHGESGIFGSNGANSFGSQSSGSAGYGGNEQQVQQSAFDHGHGDKHDIELLKENGQQQLQSSDHGQWQQGYKFSGPSQSSSSYSAGSSGTGYGESSSGTSQGAFNGASSSRYQHDASGSGFSGSGSGASIGTKEGSIGTSGSESGYGVPGAGFGVNTGSSSGTAEQASVGTGGSESKYRVSGAGFGASGVGSSSEQASVGTGISGSGYRAGEGGSSSAGAGLVGYHGSKVGHVALNGALNLASQGLQTAQDGCSTCGRSSYAFSNAKSKTGDAVAVSVGG